MIVIFKIFCFKYSPKSTNFIVPVKLEILYMIQLYCDSTAYVLKDSSAKDGINQLELCLKLRMISFFDEKEQKHRSLYVLF